jgi:hypothetical protein
MYRDIFHGYPWGWSALTAAALGLMTLAPSPAAAQLVPGTGQVVGKVGDNLEDPEWTYVFNLPKSSDEQDKQTRVPGGASKNGRWYEGVMRGQPDVIKRVPTPEGGIEGSTGALLMRSLQTGIPGSHSYHFQQDDMIVNVSGRIGPVSVARAPSVVVRVYVPPFDQWEQRTGPSFGFRAALQAYKTETKKGRWGGSSTKLETYWPGIFIHFTKGNGKDKADSASMVLRGGPLGHDFNGPKITEPGWITLGMSFTPDGQVHYYAHNGVEPLTAKDRLSSQYPYSLRAEQLDAFFFNVVSGDNGNWSTPWIVDDPALYVAR